MTPVYPTTHRIYAYLNDVRTNISSDIIGNITGQDWGIIGNGPLDRVGSAGQLKLILNDNTGKYTPGSLTALSGWDEGIPLELELVYESNTYLFRFYVSSIKPPSKFQDITTEVTATSWMHFAGKHPIENPGVLTNQRGNEVLNELLTMMPQQPQNTLFDEGINIFPVTWDTVTSTTKAYDEIVKVAMSEIGYVYEIFDRQYGETLRFENARSRNGLRDLSSLPVSQANSGYLLQAGNAFFIRTPGNDKIILNQVTDAIIDNTMIDVISEYGHNVINHFTAWAHPRRLDASPVILFQLDNPIALGSYVLIEIKGTWADPNGGNSINAQDIIDPVITTDYLVNSQEDGLGTDISTGLVFETKRFGSEGFTIQVWQTATSYNGWLTFFQVRGYGIYTYNPISAVAKNQTSIDLRGASTETITQKYKEDLYEARAFIETEVNREKDPRKVLNGIRICANTSAALMTAFLNLHPGDLIDLTIDKIAVDGYYYIQGVDNISISTGGIIMFDWILRESLSLISGLALLAVEFGGVGTTDSIDFGHLPNVYSDSTPEQLTISAWVYADTLPSTYNYRIFSFSTEAGGWRIALPNANPGEVRVFSNVFDADFGSWRTTTTPITAGGWHHIVVTFDISSIANDPIVYVDGALKTITEVTTPNGTTKISKTGIPIQVGNAYGSGDYPFPFDGKIKDVRVYHTIFPAGNVITLYNGGVQSSSILTDGLVFQAFTVKANQLADYTNATLSKDNTLLDNIYGAIGTPHGNPIGRAP